MDYTINSNDYNAIHNLCEDLIKIFQDEEGLYLELIKTEDEKKEAIMSKDANKLLTISREQENYLQVVDSREKERSNIIQKLSEILKSGKEIEKVSDVTNSASMPADLKEKLLHHSYALRELMLTLKNITGTNQAMLEDNKRLFDSLIEELTSGEEELYGPQGKSKNSTGPLFVNING